MNLEKRLISLAFAGAAIACAQPSIPKAEGNSTYFSDRIEVKKTESHPAFDLYNAIINPPKDKNAGGNPVENSTIKFCYKDKWIEVPAAETNYVEVARNSNMAEKTSRANEGSRPCELILSNGQILKIVVLEKN